LERKYKFDFLFFYGSRLERSHVSYAGGFEERVPNYAIKCFSHKYAKQ